MMAEYYGVWFCTKLPLSQGGLSEKNLNIISNNMNVLHTRIAKESEEKNKVTKELNDYKKSFKDLGERYIALKDKLQIEKTARVASSRRVQELANNRENEEEFMSGFARTMRRIASDINFIAGGR